MTPLDPRDEMTLELSRLTQEPSAADRTRNLAALRERLGLPLPIAGTLEHGAMQHGALQHGALQHGVTAPGSLPVQAAAQASWARLAAVGTVTAAIGFFVGLSVQRPAPLAEQPARIAEQPARVAEQPARVAEQSPRAAEQPSTVPPAPALVPPSLSAPPASASAEGRRRPVTRAASPSKRGARAARERSADFPEAVRLLRRARSALSKGEAPFALSLLNELDARFPPDVLDEERGATRVLALCANGDEAAAKKLALRLLREYPRSIYAPRLELSCAFTGEPSSSHE